MKEKSNQTWEINQTKRRNKEFCKRSQKLDAKDREPLFNIGYTRDYSQREICKLRKRKSQEENKHEACYDD